MISPLDTRLIDEPSDLRELALSADLDPSIVEAACDSPTLDEAALDRAALELRRRWLQRAHRPADGTLKSPCAGTEARLPDGNRIRFGYERDLDVSALEVRTPLDFAVPEGWSSARVLLRSGQAALSCLLQLVAWLNEEAGTLRVHHAGRYFETAALLGLQPRHMLQFLGAEAAAVDLVVGEPVFCDGRFGVTDPATLPRARRALLLDTTLTAVNTDLTPWFARVDGPLVAVFRSGLKLDQAGLELANAGIVQVFVRDGGASGGAGHELDDVVGKLKRVRALTGGGLTLDETAALSAPWFLDRRYLARYTSRVFAHNASLATATQDSGLFEPGCHPSLLGQGPSHESAVAPFCALRVRDGDLGAHQRLLATLDREIERRGLVVAKGGSFGFRGPRYELIQPEPSEGAPFVRVALGFRDGPANAGLTHLLGEIAAGKLNV